MTDRRRRKPAAMPHWQKVLAVILLALFVAALVVGLFAGTAARGATISQMTYRVAVQVEGGRNLGSGTAIHPRVIATASHVVGHRIAKEVTVSHAFDDKQWRAQTVAFDPRLDLALLWLDEEVPAVAEIGPPPVAGDVVRCAGYGTTGTLRSGQGKILRVGSQVYCSVWVQSGDSGCGMFNSRGQLCAVISACDGSHHTNDYVEGSSIATDSGRLKQFCQQWQAQCGPGGCNIFPQWRPAGEGMAPNRMQPIPRPDRIPDTIPFTPGQDARALPANPSEMMKLALEFDRRLKVCEADVSDLKSRKPEPGPAGPPGPPGPAGKDGRDGKDAAPSTLPAGLDFLSTPKLSHFVLVADRQADTWPRLESELIAAQAAFPRIHVCPIERLAFRLEPVPQLVSYDTSGQATAISKGSREVEMTLRRVAVRELK